MGFTRGQMCEYVSHTSKMLRRMLMTCSVWDRLSFEMRGEAAENVHGLACHTGYRRTHASVVILCDFDSLS